MIKLYCTVPELKPKFLNIISPFPATLWILLASSLVVVMVVLFVLEQLDGWVRKSTGRPKEGGGAPIFSFFYFSKNV